MGEALHIDPCIPRGWPGFEITYRHRGSVYRITVDNPERVCRGVSTLGLDGASLDPSGLVPLVSDGHDHAIQVDLG